MNKIVRDKIHPLGCPIDTIQLPVCLEEGCVLWMDCGVYAAYMRSKLENIEKQAKEGQKHEQNSGRVS